MKTAEDLTYDFFGATKRNNPIEDIIKRSYTLMREKTRILLALSEISCPKMTRQETIWEHLEAAGIQYEYKRHTDPESGKNKSELIIYGTKGEPIIDYYYSDNDPYKPGKIYYRIMDECQSMSRNDYLLQEIGATIKRDQTVDGMYEYFKDKEAKI